MRQIPTHIADNDRRFLDDVFTAHPDVAKRFGAIWARQPADRPKMVHEIMARPMERVAKSLNIPEAWRQSRAERAKSRSQIAQWFAPQTLPNPQRLGHMARMDEEVRSVIDYVAGGTDLGKQDRHRLGVLAATEIYPPKDWEQLKIARRVSIGRDQADRWVADTGRLQTLTRALQLEAQLPHLKDDLDMIWIRSGGGQMRSDGGKAMRRALVLERQAMHQLEAVEDTRPYEGTTPLIRMLGQIPGKEGLQANLTSNTAVSAVTQTAAPTHKT